MGLKEEGKVPPWTGGHAPPRIRGSVTAELAVVLPAVTVLLALLLLGVSTGMLQLRLEEGARAGARALARGDSPGQVTAVVSRVAGDNVSTTVGSSGGYGTVTVRGRTGGALSGLVPWTQKAQATAKLESSTLPPSNPKVMKNPAVGHTATAEDSQSIRKASLWRWARTAQCPVAKGRCEAVATGWEEQEHGWR